MKNSFSRQVTVFHGRKLPEEGFLAGYAQLLAIIETQFNIEIPLPDQLAMVFRGMLPLLGSGNCSYKYLVGLEYLH